MNQFVAASCDEKLVSEARNDVMAYFSDRQPHDIRDIRALKGRYPHGVVPWLVLNLIVGGVLVKKANEQGLRSSIFQWSGLVPSPKHFTRGRGLCHTRLVPVAQAAGTVERPEWTCRVCGKLNTIIRLRGCQKYKLPVSDSKCKVCRRVHRVVGLWELKP